MEVLNDTRKSTPLALATSTADPTISKEEDSLSDQGCSLGGTTLVQTVVSLTELPETWVHQEMDEILKAAGHRSESLTLEQLRAAMISYLEAIQADIEANGECELENDAIGFKTPVILD